MEIRQATRAHINEIKMIAGANRKSLGFSTRATFEEAVEKGWLLVALEERSVVGFAHYRHRQDDQTTLYEICVRWERRGEGFGRALMAAVIDEAQAQGKERVVLKTPTHLPANTFYRKLGFTLKRVEPGKNHNLNVWEWSIMS